MRRRAERIAEALGLAAVADGNTAGVHRPGEPVHIGILHSHGAWRLEIQRHHSERRAPDRLRLGDDDEGFDGRLKKALASIVPLIGRDEYLAAQGCDPTSPPAWAYRISAVVRDMRDDRGEPIRQRLIAALAPGAGAAGRRMRVDIAGLTLVRHRDRVIVDSWNARPLTLAEDMRGLQIRIANTTLPDTLLAAARGRRLREVVDHVLVSDVETRIRRLSSSMTQIVLGMGNELSPLDSPPPGLAPPWL